jgi:hypothetical protein
MRALGLRGADAVGASFSTRKVSYFVQHTLTWRSPETLDDVKDDLSVIDTFHPFFFRYNKCVQQ